MPVAKRKLIIIAILAVIIIALGAGAYIFLAGNDAAPEPSDVSYFTVNGLSDVTYFNGENVTVRAIVVNDMPLVDTTVAGSGNSSNASKATPMPTPKVRQTVIAELKGDHGFDSVRTNNVVLAHNESRALQFDFGQVPAGSYVVLVSASSDGAATKSAGVTVKPTPLMNEWAPIGDVAFLLDNLGYDRVDVNIRNSGQRTVTFGGQQYNIFVNSSDDFGVLLQGFNQTQVPPGKTVTLHAEIPAAGGYYLDYFAIAVPGRAGLVKIPWGVWMTPT